MGINFDGDAKGEDDFQAGPARPKPGKYHAFINYVNEDGISDDPEVREQSKSAGKVVVGFQVLAGTIPGQEGTEIREYFSTSEKAIPRLKKLAYVTGLLSSGDKGKSISFSEARGAHLIIEVESHSYEKDGSTRESVQVGFYGFWSIGHRDVKDVPVKKEAIGKSPKELGGGESQESSGSGEPQSAATGGGGGGSIDDIEL